MNPAWCCISSILPHSPARGRIPVRAEGRGTVGRAPRGSRAGLGPCRARRGLGEAALPTEKALLMETKMFAFEKPGVGERASGLPWKPRAEPCRSRSRSRGGSEGSGTPRGSAAHPGALRETGPASHQRWEQAPAAGKGLVMGWEAEPGRAEQSRGHQPGVNKSHGVTAAGAAAHWLPLLSPGRSIQQIRAGRTMRERAPQTPITPKLIDVFLNKHYGSASNGAEAAAEVSRGRRSNSLARGDGVGRIPKQEWEGKTIARSEHSWGKTGALSSAQHGDCAPPASRRAADQ